MAKFKVRDKRESGYFQIDTCLIKIKTPEGKIEKSVGAILGVYGVAVYTALAAFADNDTQIVWPSYGTIARLLGCSRRQVIRAIAKLEELNLIQKSPRFDEAGDATSNYITLLHRNLWQLPGGVVTDSHHLVTDSHHGSDSQSPPVVTHSHHPSDSQSPKLSLIDLSSNELALIEGGPPPRSPVDFSQKAISVWCELVGRKANKVQKSLITNLVENLEALDGYFDLELWRVSIKSVVESGCNPPDFQAIHNTYRCGKNPTPPTEPARPLSPLQIYLSVTKIKKAENIPEAVTAWLATLDSHPDYSPEALRKAVRTADSTGDKRIFDVETLDLLLEFGGDWPDFTTNNGKDKNWYTDEESKLIQR